MSKSRSKRSAGLSSNAVNKHGCSCWWIVHDKPGLSEGCIYEGTEEKSALLPVG